MANITMRDLLKAGVHFGHRTRFWSPKMKPYIFGERDKIHIINLEKTLPMLKAATDFLGSVATDGGKILFVGTKRQASTAVRENAERCYCAYVDHRWLGGMLTNYKTVKNSISRLKELEQTLDSAISAGMSKKEALNLSRERFKLDRALRGIKDMDGLPNAIFVIDIQQEAIAVAEAKKLGIAVVAVVDSNCSPDLVDYIIPGNDDSATAIRLYLTAVADAINEARTAAGVEPPKPAEKGVAEEKTDAKVAGVVTTGDGEPTSVKVTVKKTRTKTASADKKPATEEVADKKVVAKKTTTKKATAKKTAKKKVAKKTATKKKVAAK